jgi:hypothetical protein
MFMLLSTCMHVQKGTSVRLMWLWQVTLNHVTAAIVKAASAHSRHASELERGADGGNARADG